MGVASKKSKRATLTFLDVRTEPEKTVTNTYFNTPQDTKKQIKLLRSYGTQAQSQLGWSQILKQIFFLAWVWNL